MQTASAQLKNSFSNLKFKMENARLKTKAKSSKKGKVLSSVLVILALVLSYALNVYTTSFQEANAKLLLLFVYSFAGFLGFFALYFIAYFITLLFYNKKRKKIAKTIISCDDNIAEIFSDNKHQFKYDLKLNFNDNLTDYLNGVLQVVKQIADGYRVKKGEYYYLNFTIYDGVKIISDAIDGIDVKISPIFKFLHAEDKPLKIVEKLLVNALESEKQDTQINNSHKPQILQAFLETAKKAGVMLIKTPLEGALNDLKVFVSYEAFKVYGKDGKKYLPYNKEDR